MKKKMMLVLALFIAMMFTVPVFAAGKAETAYQKYRNKHGVISYKLVDIDKNGVKEMLFLTKKASYGVCTYRKKKVVCLASMKLGKYYPYVYYSKSKRQFALTGSDTGGVRYKVYKLKNGKATLIKTLKSERQYPGFDYKYYINGKTTTSSAFEKAYRAIWKWKMVDLTKY